MLFIAVAFLVVAVVPPLVGSYAGLASIRLRHVWLVAAAIVAQVVILSVVEIEAGLLNGGVHLASYALIGAFVVVNRHVRWLWVIALGWASNTAAIAANGGVMPMSAPVARALGVPLDGDGDGTDRFANSAPVDDARLAVLGDIFVTPGGLPLRNSFSIGDVLLVVGLVLVVAAASRTPPPTTEGPVSTASPAPDRPVGDPDRA